MKWTCLVFGRGLLPGRFKRSGDADSECPDPSNRRSAETQYRGVSGQYGTYSVSGDKLTLKAISAMSPAVESSERVATFRKDGADVIVTSIGTNGSKTETRWRPVK
jgi:hypothetical protein